MQTVDEEEIETIHLYVVREEEARPSVLPIILSVLALSFLVALCALSPYQQPEERLAIRLPAVFLPVKSFTSSVHIIPTGIKAYSATNAHGVLTIYNGSILSQQLPQGMILTSTNGIEIVTDESIFISAGNPPYYSIATVSAHAAAAGQQENIAAFSINQVYGTSLYIRNLQAFKGGKNSYSVKVETAQDRQTALDSARAILTTQEAEMKEFLAYPCKEFAQEKNGRLGLSWACQFVTYAVPSYMHVTAVRLVGKILFVDVVFVPRPRIIQFK
jgi:hypothetical protein